MQHRIFITTAVLLAAVLPAWPSDVAKQLSIVRPTLRQYEDGPPLAPGFSVFTGDLLFFSFNISGYKVSPESKVDLRCQIDAVDPDGVPLADTIHQSVDTHVSAEDKNWMPIVRGNVQIPPLALGGTYHVKITVEDKLSGQTAKADIAAPVRGKQVEPSQTLVARNFRFERSEEDSDSLIDPVYHPGDAVWARFEITGFRYGEKNRVDVEYGVGLIDSTGKSLFSQPRAAVEQETSFYPKRYLPGVLSLNLDKDVRPGEYKVVLTLRDGVGNQTQETQYSFRVE